MENLLTTEQVLELLKIDRTTIYRMLKEGRLKAVKVGSHWRFPRNNVQELITAGATLKQKPQLKIASVLPIHCINPIQDVFAEIAGVGAITTSPKGQPLTEISNSCRFCNLILSSEKGRQGCIASWKKLASQPENHPRFVTCHAGLQYARARIELEGELAAMLVAGQFYRKPADPDEQTERVRKLARDYGLNEKELAEAIEDITILEDDRSEQIGIWLEKVAHSFEQVTRERAEYSHRLFRIANLSNIEEPYNCLTKTEKERHYGGNPESSARLQRDGLSYADH